MKKFLPLACLCLTAALARPARAAEPAAAPLTLQQTLDTVLAHYPSIDAAQAALAAARGRTDENRADFRPQLSATAAYNYLSPRPYVEFALPGGASSLYESVQDNYNVALHLRQLVTDFGRTATLLASVRSGEITAQDALAQTRSELGYQTIQDFYAVLLLRRSVAVDDEEISALREALRIAEQKFTAGTATRFDVLTTRVRLANAGNRRTDTLAALRKQETLLRQLLGDAPGAPLPLRGDFDAGFAPPDLSAVCAEGLRDRPEIKLARDAEKTAGLRLAAADRADRPVVSAEVTGGVQNGTMPSLYDNKGYLAAGVSLTVPILTGHRTASQRAVARADLRAAQDQVRVLARTITTDVENAFSDLAAAEARYANSDTLVAQAEEALALAQTRYANGVITNFELLDAQSAARAAELTRLQARYDCTLARQAIARAAGQPPQA